MKKFADKKTVHREIKIGDHVLLRRDKLANKLKALLDPSPYRVTKVKKSMWLPKETKKKLLAIFLSLRKLKEKKSVTSKKKKMMSIIKMQVKILTFLMNNRLQFKLSQKKINSAI